MKNKEQRLGKKNPDHLTPIERGILRVENSQKKPKLDVVSSIAMLWSVANQVTKVHGFNGGSQPEQVKIVMKTAYEQRQESEFTPARILELWNERKHGQPHTKQQVASALHALKEKGFVIIVGNAPRSDGSPGKPGSKYALASVIERLTNPGAPVGAVTSEEPEIKSVEIGNGEIKITGADSPVGVILTKLTQLKYDLNSQFKVIEAALETGDTSNTRMRDAYNNLITKLHDAIAKWTEIHDHNQNANNDNWASLTQFVENTNGNFIELQSYYTDILALLRTLQDTKNTNSNFDNRYYEQQITQAYRSGYKEGFADGRKDYKSELTNDFRPEIQGP